MKAPMPPVVPESHVDGTDLLRPERIIPAEVIPAALKQLPQWVCWRYVDRGPDKKPDKRPVNPHTLRNASVTWPTTWSNFPHTYTVYLMLRARRAPNGINGIGFVLTPDDPFVGLDLDHCLEDGVVLPWAQAILEQVPSYTEISPSGMGLRILVNAPDFIQNRRRGTLEIYSHARFLTLTGNHLAGTPGEVLAIDAARLATLIPIETYDEPVHRAPTRHPPASSVGHDVLWERIFTHDRFGEQHRQRFLGDTSLDGGDHSLTVIRLLNTLARWTGGDAAQMRALMERSPLANPKWWSKRGSMDWLDRQIADAIGHVRCRK